MVKTEVAGQGSRILARGCDYSNEGKLVNTRGKKNHTRPDLMSDHKPSNFIREVTSRRAGNPQIESLKVRLNALQGAIRIPKQLSGFKKFILVSDSEVVEILTKLAVESKLHSALSTIVYTVMKVPDCDTVGAVM